jgi:hypothetical protein
LVRRRITAEETTPSHHVSDGMEHNGLGVGRAQAQQDGQPWLHRTQRGGIPRTRSLNPPWTGRQRQAETTISPSGCANGAMANLNSGDGLAGEINHTTTHRASLESASGERHHKDENTNQAANHPSAARQPSLITITGRSINKATNHSRTTHIHSKQAADLRSDSLNSN